MIKKQALLASLKYNSNKYADEPSHEVSGNNSNVYNRNKGDNTDRSANQYPILSAFQQPSYDSQTHLYVKQIPTFFHCPVHRS
jgi:hypothetical protein